MARYIARELVLFLLLPAVEDVKHLFVFELLNLGDIREFMLPKSVETRVSHDDFVAFKLAVTFELFTAHHFVFEN